LWTNERKNERISKQELPLPLVLDYDEKENLPSRCSIPGSVMYGEERRDKKLMFRCRAKPLSKAFVTRGYPSKFIDFMSLIIAWLNVSSKEQAQNIQKKENQEASLIAVK